MIKMNILYFFLFVRIINFQTEAVPLNINFNNTNDIIINASKLNNWKKEWAMWGHQKITNGVGYFVHDPIQLSAFITGTKLPNGKKFKTLAESNDCKTVTPIVACSGNGQCLPNDSCLCNDDYDTFECGSNIQCCYKKTSRIGAFLFEFIFGMETGAGLWYIGRSLIAGVQLMMFLFIFVFFSCSVVSEECWTCCYCIVIIDFLVIFGMWLAYVILIGNGSILDGNGIELSDW